MSRPLIRRLTIGTVLAMLVLVPVFTMGIIPAYAASNANATAQAARTQRITKLKNQYNPHLTIAMETRLKARCHGAQGIVQGITKSTDAIASQRSQALGRLDEQIDTLLNKLQTTDLDVSQLQEQQQVLASKITAFTAEKTAYDQILADLGAMDCVSDPSGFQAALEAARASRGDLAKALDGIHGYTTNTIESTLGQLRKQLTTSTADTTNESMSVENQ